MRSNVLFGKRQRENREKEGERRSSMQPWWTHVLRIMGSTTMALGCLNSLAMYDAPHQKQDTTPPQMSSSGSCRKKGVLARKGEATAALLLLLDKFWSCWIGAAYYTKAEVNNPHDSRPALHTHTHARTGSRGLWGKPSAARPQNSLRKIHEVKVVVIISQRIVSPLVSPLACTHRPAHNLAAWTTRARCHG